MTSEHDKTIIRKLAEQLATIAADPVHAETAARWTQVNDLQPTRPPVLIYQVPWREMNVDDELTLQAEDPPARKMEESFRKTLYTWRHFPVDMVVDPVYHSGFAVHSTGVGISKDMETIPHDEDGGVTSKHYHCQIQNEADLEKIKTPEVSCDWQATDEQYEWARDMLDGILRVEKRGCIVQKYSPWDRLSEWCNPQQILMDLILRPDFIHKAIDRLVTAYLAEMDQMEELNLLTVANGNYGVGQGGLGFTRDLPQSTHNPEQVRLNDHWGGSMAQIFSEVSPDMHEEFALQYEKRFLDRCGLVYYGCCEPLHHKVDIVSKHLTNLRKISMSPWADAKKGAEAIGDRFVFSFKPNPAFLATDKRWDRDSAQRELENVLEVTRGMAVEVILKDISTVRFEPQRLSEWAEMAISLVRQYE